MGQSKLRITAFWLENLEVVKLSHLTVERRTGASIANGLYEWVPTVRQLTQDAKVELFVCWK